jgi:hypothetical protein
MWRPTVGIVPAGSLIFVIIVAIWAAYLLQHWVRRQENVAGTRSVDRFSQAMRVLESRPALPETQPAVPHARASSSVRVIRPVVDVKRAVPAGDVRRSPLVARSSTDAVPDSHEVDPMPHQTHSTHQTHQMPAHRTARQVSLLQRRLRAVLLLAALAWVPTSVVLVVLDRLLWVSIPFSLLTVAAVVVWLRTEATADRARRSSRGRRRPEPQHVLSSDDTQVIRAEAVAQAAAAASAAASAAAAAASAALSAPATHAPHPDAAPGPAAYEAAYEQVFDGEAARSQPVPVVQPDPSEGTWAPVPVPRPTYAMKSKAQPRLTASGIPADVFDTPEFAEEAEELDERALFARRAVSE